MEWTFARVLILCMISVHVSTSSEATSARKCKLVGDDTVVCTIQNKEFDTSSDGDDDDGLEKEEESELTERSSGWNLNLRTARRRKTAPKCFVAASTIQCEGGLKLTGLGPLGRSGSPGLPGPKVGKGVKGDRGMPGRPGPDGPEGPRGRHGQQGSKGSQGEKGDKGDTGYQGRQGSPGFPSNCDVTPSLQTKCPKGAKGAYGIKGSTGAEGDVGRTGANGPRGNQGFKGARGDAGVPGGVGLYGALRLSSPCRHLYSPWVVPYGSPIGQLKTECRFREYLLALNIQPDNNSNRIRYDYKCCPF